MSKSRKEKAEEYDLKYGFIPRDNDQRLAWLIDQFKLTPSKMNDIIEKKRNMETYLQYYTYKLVLYEDPEGAKRPRFRLVNRKNYMNMAIQARDFVHVYSPIRRTQALTAQRIFVDLALPFWAHSCAEGRITSLA